ncbi:MAG: Zn-dependent hydrolase [Gemmatimonadetes bacterium]|nr:Zn-dependent hydrolase [Gemmatimonadota bacterium]
MSHRKLCAAALLALALPGCAAQTGPQSRPIAAARPLPMTPSAVPVAAVPAASGAGETVPQRLARYTPVRLTTDLSKLSESDRRMLPLLIDAARQMDAIFWLEAYGSREELMNAIRDPQTRTYAEINYGPWDRLEENAAFIPGTPAKRPGANFYPADVTKEEFDRAVAGGGARADSLKSLYTLVRRDEGGRLVAIPYHVAFRPYVESAAASLRQAAQIAGDPGLRRYLELRAQALLTDDYQPSDLAWMDMKDNTLDLVIGPIETYEDELYGYKAGHESYVLIKDREWSQRLARYVALLPSLQRGLPVAEEFKRETPGTGSDLNAYDAVYYAGEANAGAKTIAINLPNDEQVQLRKGTRRLQLKNAMRAKFDRILVPVARELIVPDEMGHVTFDAFFENTMFHEVAHGLGIKNTINSRRTVREALKERAGGLEEEKADVLGLYMVSQLAQRGELGQRDLRDNFTTFLAGLFRSVRFGASDAHGRAKMATFNFFQEMGAFSRDPATGKYRVDYDRMQQAVNALSAKILQLQGTGDYAGVGEFMTGYGVIKPQLQQDLARLSAANIPVDVVFDQGMSVLQP